MNRLCWSVWGGFKSKTAETTEDGLTSSCPLLAPAHRKWKITPHPPCKRWQKFPSSTPPAPPLPRNMPVCPQASFSLQPNTDLWNSSKAQERERKGAIRARSRHKGAHKQSGGSCSDVSRATNMSAARLPERKGSTGVGFTGSTSLSGQVGPLVIFQISLH